MNFENIKFENENNIAYVTLSRPNKLNALSVELFLELKELLNLLNINSGKTRGLILTGEGSKAFAAGADIKQMSKMSKKEAQEFSALAQEVTLLLEELPFPTIACVDGFALGGGCELAMACDFIYATEKSKFGQPEVSLGLIPGFGGCIRFVRALGLPKAKEYIFTGRQLTAKEAVEFHLVSRVFKDKDELLANAKETMLEVFKNSPAAVALTKKVIQTTVNEAPKNALLKEQQAFTDGFDHPEKHEGVLAFLEKRSALFCQ